MPSEKKRETSEYKNNRNRILMNFSLSRLSFLDQSLLYLNILIDSLDDVISSEHHHDNHEAVHWLAESLELVFSCLRRRREAYRGATEREEGGAANDVMFVPRSAFQSFKSFILSSVSFLETVLKVLAIVYPVPLPQLLTIIIKFFRFFPHLCLLKESSQFVRTSWCC